MTNHLHKGNVERIRDLTRGRSIFPQVPGVVIPAARVTRYRFEGSIDAETVDRRWTDALRRWEPLRSIIKTINSRQMLVVLKQVPFMPVFRAKSSAADVRQDRDLPGFDFDRGPLYSVEVETDDAAFDVVIAAADGLLSTHETAAIAHRIGAGTDLPVLPIPPTRARQVSWSPVPRSSASDGLNYSACVPLDADIAADLTLLTKRLNCTVGDIAASIWTMLHAVYADSEDVTVAIASSANHNSIEVLRGQVGADASLVNIANVLRTPDVTRFFFNAEMHQPPGLLCLYPEGAAGKCVDVQPGPPRSDLDVHLFGSETNPTFAVAGRLPPQTCERVVAHLIELLRYCSQNPDRTDWRDHVLSEEDRRIIDANCLTARPGFRPYFEAIDGMAARHPEKECVRAGSRSLTYANFAALVAAQGEVLQSHRVGPGDIVAVIAQRCPEMIASIVAINKLGAVYLPLDPADASGRNRRILAIAKPAIVLTSRDERAAVTAAIGAMRDHRVVAFGSRQTANGHSGFHSQSEAIAPDHPANIFFTSGTTGDPKGIILHHEGVWNHLVAKIEVCGLGNESIVAQNAAHTFDIAHWQMLAPLMVGGCTVIYPAEIAQTPDLLLPLLSEDRVTVLETVPTYIRELNRMGAKAPATLSVLLSNAEALSPADCAQWLSHNPHVPIINTYGATECSDDVTHRRFDTAADMSTPYLSVGRPIQGAAVIVLGRHGSLQPVGCPGEINIAGTCVGHGYLSDEARTKASFLHNPYPYHPDRLRYRTGDRGYLQEDGEFAIIGRDDDQIKINGYRVELGEIESVIAGLRLFETFHLLTETLPDGATRLDCYYVPTAKAARNSLDPTVLASALKPHLPAYMIPATFCSVDAIPVTTHGKVDRARLRQMAGNVLPQTIRRPETALEKTLHAMWSVLLDRSDFGIDEDFFQLGGNSIRTIQLRYRLQQAIRTDIPLAYFFAARTIRHLAERIAAADKTEGSFPAISRAPEGQPVPLSPLQQGLWFLHQIEPNSRAYNMTEVLVLRERIDTDSLSGALEDLLRRHPILSANVVAGLDGPPVLELCPTARRAFEVIDTGGGGAVRTLEAIIAGDGDRRYDLEKDALFRLKLARQTGGCDTLIISMHHIIADERSWQVIKHDLSRFYALRASGATAPARPEPLHYLDFAVWHDAWCRSEDGRKRLANWRERLADVSLWVDLPEVSPQKQSERKASAFIEVLLPKEEVGTLERLCTENNATTFLGGLALYAVFLSRISGRGDFCVATPVNCRPLVDLPDCVGLFANLIPLRLRLKASDTFNDVLANLRHAFHSSAEDALVPLHRIVQMVQGSRSEHKKNTFSSAYFLGEESVAEKGVFSSAQRIDPPTGDSRFDLMVTAQANDKGLVVRFDYNSELIDERTIRRWSDLYLALSRELIANPSKPIAQLNENSFARSVAISGGRVGKVQKRVSDYVIEQANRTPDAIAVSSGEQSLSYRDLVTRAINTATLLQERLPTVLEDAEGSRPPIAIGMAPGTELAVALLATMIAGYPFLPIDPTIPRRRILDICQDSGARLALVDARDSANLSTALPSAITVAANSDDHRQRDVAATSSDALAYVIYTSGSTGIPKGVQISHAALSNTMQGVLNRVGAAAAERVLSLTSVSFDIFQLELWLPLITGGTCYLCPPKTALEPERLVELMALARPTLVQATPSTWSLILPSVRQMLAQTVVLVGGEALPESLAILLRQHARTAYNCYGPTEATIWASMTKVEEHVPLHVGDALPNVDFLVLGESGQPVPQGTVGELCIVSDALADGYVNRPEETASCFLPRERDGKAHWDQRLYRTGDFMRHDGHGVLAFLGRRDDQVKIRGFRVELTEIEHVIEAEPDVDQAVVIRNPHAAAHDALVAFVRPDRPPSALKAIEAKLSDRLPDYMVPRQWIGLNSMPMTTNGKLDRKTLVSIIPTRIGESDATEPRFPLEASILSEWTSHLGTEQIGVHDDFFQVGGNSITAVGLAKALTRGLGRSVTVGDIFRAPTVAAMAVALTAKSSVHAKETTLIPLNRIDDAKAKEPLFLIHPQGGGIACYHDLARCLDGKIAVYGIQAIGFADPSRAPLGSIDEMSERYVHDIQALDPPAGQVHLAGWSFGGAIAVEVARVLSEHGMEVGFVGLFDAAPFQPRQDRTAPVSELFVKRWFASVYLEEDPIDDFELDHEAIDHRLVLGLRDKGMIGPGAEGQEQLNHLVNYMRHNIEVARTYQFRRPIASDLWLFRVSELPLKEKRALVEPLAWSRFTTGEIRTIPVPGHHHTMLASDNAEPLARELWNCLRWSKEQNASKRNQHRSAEMEIYR